MLSWIILGLGSVLTLAVVGGLIETAVKERREGKGNKVGRAVLLSVVIAIMVGFIQYTVVWPWAMDDYNASMESVVKDFFKEKTGRVPDEVKLQPAESTKSGEVEAYVGTARFGADEVWDVRVWREFKKFKAEATPRTRKEGGQ